MADLKKITAFLDRTLKIDRFEDDSNNGLQVENSGQILKVCAGVDASMEFFREAENRGADLLLCHHGLSWKDSLSRITGLNYRHLKFLLERDMALYACHLPLDAHPELGNNAQICKALKLRNIKPFGKYRGGSIGFRGELSQAQPYSKFKASLQVLFANDLSTMDFGREKVKSVAVVSGGGSSATEEAGVAGIDVFISGEPELRAYNLAEELGLNAVFAGHYATETFGVRATAAAIARRFKVKTEFIDLKIPF